MTAKGRAKEMSKTKADKLIEILDLTEARRSKWKIAVDEDIHGFKTFLDDLGFLVIKFDKGIKDEDLHVLLLQNKVDFFVTKNGGDFLKYLGKPEPAWKRHYHILWISEKLMADPKRAAKAVTDAILYDPRVKEGAAASFVKITGAYITELPKIKKESERSRKK